MGAAILALALAHVAGLWLYSPEDITDALLLRALTTFSAWGVAGFAGLLAAGIVSTLRRQIPPRIWRPLHLGLAVASALCAVIHAWLIFGVIEPNNKALLCLVILASLAVGASSGLRLLRRS
ncbi:hypothetical protein D2T30_11740 [Sinirhodobacter populi]|uniref:Uncharacterized protein n=1 Tax=Paenirhodobacter populi TaxID=2306993 RepID=A0A443JJD4_9RHOB|nr:hypothetical protein D2T30_11740 [Sinirhodobacter populi]